MQMWEGEIGGAEEVATLCTWHTHRAMQNTWDTDWGGQGIRRWVLDGTQTYEEKPVHQQETVVQPASEGGDGDLGSRWTRSDNMQEQIWSATTTEKIWEFIPFRVMKKKEAFLGFCENTKNAFKLAYLFFFFLISARQGVTITEICESGWKFWRKHLSTCRQVKLELNMCWSPPLLTYSTCRFQNK